MTPANSRTGQQNYATIFQLNKRKNADGDADPFAALTARITAEIRNSNTETTAALGAKIDELGDRISSRVDQVESRVAAVESAVTECTSNVANLDMRVNDVEQAALLMHMDITGLDAANIEAGKGNPKLIVTELFTSLAITFNPDDIQAAFIRHVGMGKSVVTVVFFSFESKLAIMKKKRESRDQRKLFFDHRLTRLNRSLFLEARRLVKDKVIDSVFIKSGRVMIKLQDKSMQRATEGLLSELKRARANHQSTSSTETNNDCML